ncbi:Heat shock 22 kDa protein mitochondrial [Heracleum sosnowskyi]|uniref:Heat shock 22 kDa protein mitochondrial n=1 Tax=Heracleum sosnowskyi TaxID=360622 RepID=A0AAD8IMP2_9APIA|nr:Heat shock 22 kDa protein mitochondrial [Heracleum sosnowskyi]
MASWTNIRRGSRFSEMVDIMSTLILDDHFPVLLSKLPDENIVGVMQGCECKETDDSLIIHVDMPGLGKENVKVSLENNKLIIRGEGTKQSPEDSDESVRKYGRSIELPEKTFKLDATKAEMKNGVLKLVIPKIEKTVIHLNVE